MTKRKLVEESPTLTESLPLPSVTQGYSPVSPPLFSPGLTERQQIALVMKLSGETSNNDPYSTPRPNKVNKLNKHGESPLQKAAIKGDVKQVKLLIKQGAEVNTRDNAGWSPLHEAACNGYMEVCKILLKHGANVNVHGLGNETPLHDASAIGNVKIVALLLAHGANPLAKNDNGKQPHEVTENKEIIELLTGKSVDTDPLSKSPLPEMIKTEALKTEAIVEDSSGIIETPTRPNQSLRTAANQTIRNSLYADNPSCRRLIDQTPDRRRTSESGKTSDSDAEAEDLEGSADKPPEAGQSKPENDDEEGVEEVSNKGTEDGSQYYRYSHLMPQSVCFTSVTENGPVTLYVARNKRPVKRAPLLESRSPPATRSRAGGKPVDTTEVEELRSLNSGRFLLKSAVVTPRKKWLHQQQVIRKRHLGDIYESQKRGVPDEPHPPSWLGSSMVYSKKYLLQNSVVGKVDSVDEHEHTQYLPPIMRTLLDRTRKERMKMICRHTADKERLIQQHEHSMLRARRQAIMKHPSPSVCSVLLQQHNAEYSKKLQSVNYDINNDQLLLSMGEKVLKTFEGLSEELYNRQKHESDTLYSAQRFKWINCIHQQGLYDMPVLGNLDVWISRVNVVKLVPKVEYYDESQSTDSDEDA